MSVSVHENRKSRASTGSMNITLFHKTAHADNVLTRLGTLRKQSLFTDVVLHAGQRAFPCHRAVLAACSHYFEAMFAGGLRESYDSEVNFHDSIHPEVLELLLDYAYSSRWVFRTQVYRTFRCLLVLAHYLFNDVNRVASHFESLAVSRVSFCHMATFVFIPLCIYI